MHGTSWVALSILQIQSIPFIILNAFTRRFNENVHAWTRGLSNNVESIKYPEAVRSLCVTYCSVTWPAASHQVLVRSSYVFSGSSECLTPRAQRMSSTANTPVYTNLHQIWPAVQECPDRCTKAKPQHDRPWIRAQCRASAAERIFLVALLTRNYVSLTSVPNCIARKTENSVTNSRGSRPEIPSNSF